MLIFLKLLILNLRQGPNTCLLRNLWISQWLEDLWVVVGLTVQSEVGGGRGGGWWTPGWSLPWSGVGCSHRSAGGTK